jgi:hypothetical protein
MSKTRETNKTKMMKALASPELGLKDNFILGMFSGWLSPKAIVDN